MANINLLPWREEERAERQRQFVSVLGLVAVLGIVVVGAINYLYAKEIDQQRNRNNYLQSQIRKLDSKITEITSLEKERKDLVDRMEIIQNLQKSRPQIVHLFDEIVKHMPEGMNLLELKRQGKEIHFKGIAESAPRISNFMRNLKSSLWITTPDIEGIEDDQESGAGRKIFLLKSELTTPDAVKEGAK